MGKSLMNIEEAEKLLTLENIVAMLKTGITEQALKSGISEIKVDGSPVTIGNHLGSGGTKEIYSIELEGYPYAMAICGTLDAPERIIEKWYNVLHEPANTNRLRDIGIIVNDGVEIVLAVINGYKFPVLLMKRYADHDFPIYDPKNRTNTIETAEVSNVEDCISELRGVISDILLLIKKGAILDKDSFNLCKIGGTFRLYLNDLGSARFNDIMSDEIDEMVIEYTRFARSAYINAYSHNAIDNNRFLDALRLDYDGEPLKTRLIEEVNLARRA